MKKIILLLCYAGLASTPPKQPPASTTALKNTTPDILLHNVKHTKMKDYVFIMRLEAITPEVEAQVLPKWAKLIPQWISQGHLVDNLVIANEGTLFSGKGRAVSHAPIDNNGQIVLAVMQIKAKNMDQALELAKQSPTLDVGGSVEVREVRPTPVSTGK